MGSRCGTKYGACCATPVGDEGGGALVIVATWVGWARDPLVRRVRMGRRLDLWA